MNVDTLKKLEEEDFQFQVESFVAMVKMENKFLEKYVEKIRAIPDIQNQTIIDQAFYGCLSSLVKQRDEFNSFLDMFLYSVEDLLEINKKVMEKMEDQREGGK
jgi:GTP1/Obg family GTP-binding protein